MNEEREMKIDLKGLFKVLILLYAILLAVGILTYVMPAGAYKTVIDASGRTAVDPNSFTYITSTTRIPWYRWLTAPVETLLFDTSRGTIYQIIALLLVLGGSFRVLEESGALSALVRVLILRFHEKRFLTVSVMTVLMMLLCSMFGIFDELLILFPIFLSFSRAMRWNNKTALALVLLPSGIGFTCALFNPLTVGLSSMLAGISVTDGIWFRAGMFVILAVFTSVVLIVMAKKDEKADENAEAAPAADEAAGLTPSERTKAVLIVGLFSFVLLVVIAFSVIPGLSDLTLIAMAGAFVVGTVAIGRSMIGSWKSFFAAFWKGVKNVAPSCLIVIVAFSIKYIAEKGNILHTIFHAMSGLLTGVSPYLGVIMILAFVLVVEFFIPSATAKASLLIPLLTLAPIPGITKTVIVLAYLLGDGYTNIFYPTCGTLVIGLGLANVTYSDWVKRTGLVQLMLLASSVGFLCLAVALGI